MAFRTKAVIQRLISALPASAADRAYYLVQRRWGRLRQIDPLPDFEQILAMLADCGKAEAVRDASIFELGTGRTLNASFCLWLAGARRITTIDLHRYLRPELVQEAITAIAQRRSEVAALFSRRNIPLHDDRLRALAECPAAAAAMVQAAITYRAPADAARTGLVDASIDLHVSTNVLEHVPAEALEAILREARRIVRPNGALVHRVDCSDHFAQTDPNINLVNFLRYSPSEWRRLAGNRFMYQNRLRPSEYVGLVERAGFRLSGLKVAQDPRALAEMAAGFQIHQDFFGFSLEDLASVELVFSAFR